MPTNNQTVNYAPMYPGQAQQPAYIPGYDPLSMSLYPQMQGMIGDIQSDSRALQEFQTEALRKGPSTWAGLSNQQQALMAKNAKSSNAATAAGQNATAQSDLAMHGGLDSGARERIATGTSRNLLDMNQKVNETQANNASQIAMNDEQNRISQLGSVPGMENTQNQAAITRAQLTGQGKQFDIGNTINENTKQNAFNQANYATQMQAWGAAQQADATSKSGKK